ncbi:hypothetical protein LJC63_01070 [Ruminococcaceae bacterium OttesenSCG-928-L11]|nr:hypothetical protein [Ruminococcaceae bacterium OttesenSCG-928-L11]
MNDAGIPLTQNQYIQELHNILRSENRDTSGLTELMNHVSEMEDFVKRAEDSISDMKSQLAELKEVQNHPVKTSLQNAIKALESRLSEVKVMLSELKANIIEGAQKAVAAFKEKGVVALDNLASFFGVKADLQGWQKNIDSIIKADDKAVSKIEAFANEYHSAGRAMKNLARIAVGKEPISAKKEAGKLAKAMAAPYKMQKSAVIGLRKSLEKTVARLDGLEAKAAQVKAPSLLQKLEANKERVKAQAREIAPPERAKAQGLEV